MLHFKKYFKRDLGLTAIQTMIRFYNKIRSESSVNLDHKTSRKLPKMRLTIGSCPSHVPCFVALVLGAFSAKKEKKNTTIYQCFQPSLKYPRSRFSFNNKCLKNNNSLELETTSPIDVKF